VAAAGRPPVKGYAAVYGRSFCEIPPKINSAIYRSQGGEPASRGEQPIITGDGHRRHFAREMFSRCCKPASASLDGERRIIA